jgi:hypothetical protein
MTHQQVQALLLEPDTVSFKNKKEYEAWLQKRKR